MAFPLPSNVTTSVGMMQWINMTVNNWLFMGVILAAFFIILIKQMTNQANTIGKCVASASFICMILAVLSRLLGFVSTGFMTIFILLTAVGGIWMHIENN